MSKHRDQEQKVRELMKYGESIVLECKESSNEISKDVWETYSSFANTYGGEILLGVKENRKEADPEKRFLLTGMKNIRRRQKEFWDTLNSDKVSSNILLESDVETVSIEDKDILVIHIPPAGYRFRPVFINGNPFKGTFRRNFEGDYHCSEEEVRAMIRDSTEGGQDGLLLEGFTMDDIDQETLQAYRNQFRVSNPDHVWNETNDLEFLRNMGGYIRDRKTGVEGLTEAGLLMFGKGLSVRERFSNLSMDYLDVSSLTEGQRWSDRISIDGTWENNLYNFTMKVMRKTVEGLPKSFNMDGVIRIDETLLHKSIREAIVNMVIHADYHMIGQLKIVKYEDGFLFSNPGNLKIPVAAIYEGDHTEARNPKIQTMFRMIGFCENIGSGFPLILKAWRFKNWREPDLFNHMELHKVDLRLWMSNTLPVQAEKELFDQYGRDYQDRTEAEQIALSIAATEGSVSAVRLQPVLKSELEDLFMMLNQLTDDRFLTKKSGSRKTEYAVNEHYEKTVLSVTDSAELSQTDQELIELLKSGIKVTNKIIIQEIDSIHSLSGAVKAVNRLIDRELVSKCKEGRTVVYRLNVI